MSHVHKTGIYERMEALVAEARAAGLLKVTSELPSLDNGRIIRLSGFWKGEEYELSFRVDSGDAVEAFFGAAKASLRRWRTAGGRPSSN